uniref:Ig-like domain-containing protein n=1 Tax=Xiphophorus couchianus TaxID=32473 RepID=A0A3B5LRD5_9TELE
YSTKPNFSSENNLPHKKQRTGKTSLEYTITLGCLAQDFFPKSATFQWTSTSNTQVVSQQYIFPQQNDNNRFTGVSVISVSKSNALSYTCSLTHPAGNKTVPEKCMQFFHFSTSSFTVTLNPPNPKKMFKDKQAELKCIITGQDGATVSNTKIQWYIDGQPVANNNEAHSESSTLIRSFDEWKKVKKVQCVATRDDMAPITESNAIPDVQVHKLSNNTNEVTLVCLVTSSVLQDYYIAWLEASGPKSGTYINGINLPPQKINNSLYLVSSFYTISKNNWESTNKFSCNVWPANGKMKPHELSTTFTSASIRMSPSTK